MSHAALPFWTRYVLTFQLPWFGEALMCANDYAMLEGVLTKGPGPALLALLRQR